MDFQIKSPRTAAELFKTIRQHKNFRFGAGYTDLILDLKKINAEGVTIINLAQLNDKRFFNIEKTSAGFRLGSLVTAAAVADNNSIAKNFPVLRQAANSLASAQIRQVATIGGNLCTASPSGDIACALAALKSKCEILTAIGKLRTIPLDDFFTGPRKTALKRGEILRSVLIPVNEKMKTLFSGFIKVGTRRSMECSVVSLAYHIQTDRKGTITEAGIAAGSIAPTIRFAADACNFLKGKKISSMTDPAREKFAAKVLQYASPISDIRATAWYRKNVLFNLSRELFEN